jgi:hypothetical protein
MHELKNYIHSGLNFERYKIISYLPLNKDEAFLLMESIKESENKHYSVQFRGGGKYFSEIDDAKLYIKDRYNCIKKKKRSSDIVLIVL